MDANYEYTLGKGYEEGKEIYPKWVAQYKNGEVKIRKAIKAVSNLPSQEIRELINVK